MRWTVEADDPQQTLPPTRTRSSGTWVGEFRGMEFLHVNARTVINQVAGASRMPFLALPRYAARNPATALASAHPDGSSTTTRSVDTVLVAMTHSLQTAGIQ